MQAHVLTKGTVSTSETCTKSQSYWLPHDSNVLELQRDVCPSTCNSHPQTPPCRGARLHLQLSYSHTCSLQFVLRLMETKVHIPPSVQLQQGFDPTPPGFKERLEFQPTVSGAKFFCLQLSWSHGCEWCVTIHPPPNATAHFLLR